MVDNPNIKHVVTYFPGPYYAFWAEHARYDTSDEAEAEAARLRPEHPDKTIEVDAFDVGIMGTWIWPLI